MFTSKKLGRSVTASDITNLALKDLCTVFNEMTGSSLKRFPDKATGQRRCREALQQHDGASTSRPAKTTVGKRRTAKSGKINFVTTDNPHREGSTAHEKWAVIRRYSGKDVQSYIESENGDIPYISYLESLGHITLA